MKHSSAKAFSLIELSIVILIIGILIAGIVQGSRLIEESRLSSARAQTMSSPVASIPDLMLWIESTSEKSFDDEEQEDASNINNWYDINPQSSSKFTFTTIDERQPIYRKNAINNLPAIKFDGEDAFMEMADFPNILNDVTVIFVVNSLSAAYNGPVLAKRTDPGINIQISFIPGTGADTGWQFCSGNISDGYCLYTLPSTSLEINKVYITSIVYIAESISSTALRFFENGEQVSNRSTISDLVPTAVDGKLTLGDANDYSFNGYIGEVIIFDRALKDEERISIEEYLGKKWGVRISS
jgi:prepilin-type N-terminal cleavage/methylation domain-containing protein